MRDFVEIAAGDGLARISLHGAELKSWRIGGQELIWPGDDQFWPNSAPILFPLVGWTRDGVRVGDRKYPLGLHGFARHQLFALAERARDRVVLRLVANPATRALYPFAFRLEVEYALEANKLTISLHVKNEDDAILPFACGLHPGFAWPLPGGAGPHFVRFDAAERAEVPIIAPGGLFSARTRAIPLQGRDLPLTPALFEEALCFLGARGAGLEFCAGEGAKPSLRMEWENFPHIALWSRPGAPFLCLEAWTGHGDPENFDGDIYAKPSMRLLNPGEEARSAATFIWRA
jgi:galactose mutarotase-like enzyme